MRILLRVLCFCAFLPLSSLAQQVKPAAVPLPLPDTVYFDRDWERTLVLEDRQYARVARHAPDGATLGTVRDYYYPSWKKQWEGKLMSETPDTPAGLCTGWYENGKPQFRGTYVQGQPQNDYQEWRADGTPLKCQLVYQPALETSTVKLHSYFNDGSSRSVFEVVLPANTAGVVYKVDIRDEGAPPVSWSTALALSSVVIDPTMSTASALLVGSKALAAQNATGAPATATKCHWYLTDRSADAQEFLQTKGNIAQTDRCYRQADNVTQETRHVVVDSSTRRLYLCVNNDNRTTSATATVSVSALVRTCR